jgi:hypothetical protein
MPTIDSVRSFIREIFGRAKAPDDVVIRVIDKRRLGNIYNHCRCGRRYDLRRSGLLDRTRYIHFRQFAELPQSSNSLNSATNRQSRWTTVKKVDTYTHSHGRRSNTSRNMIIELSVNVRPTVFMRDHRLE